MQGSVHELAVNFKCFLAHEFKSSCNRGTITIMVLFTKKSIVLLWLADLVAGYSFVWYELLRLM